MKKLPFRRIITFFLICILLFNLMPPIYHGSPAYGSARADLERNLAALTNGVVLTEGAYFDQEIEAKIINGVTFTMYETLQFDITRVQVWDWDFGLTLVSLPLIGLGIAFLPATAGIICTVVGASVYCIAQLLPSAATNEYQCAAQYTRYVTAEGDSTPYSEASRVIEYTAFEEADPNSTSRAQIAPETRTEHYSVSQDYFDSGMFDAAYEAYLEAE